MVQIKKETVREAILTSARAVFEKEGYAQSTMNQIAREAGISPGTLYVYFPSKLKVFFAIYEPWLRGRLARLAKQCRGIHPPRARLERLLRGLWRDIPFADNVFSNNLIQAASISDPKEGYDDSLLEWSKAQVCEIIRECLPPARRKALNVERLVHLMFMAFDGFSLNAHLAPKRPCDEALIRTLVDLILHE